jgi:hypothetical protein
MDQELYDHIYKSLTELIDPETEENSIVVHELTSLAAEGAQRYISDLEESISHLKETIRRISKEG